MAALGTYRAWFLGAIVLAVVFGICRSADAASSNTAQSNSPATIPNQETTRVPSAIKLSVPRNGIIVEQATVCSPFSLIAPAQLPNGILQRNYRFHIQTSGGVAPVAFSLMKENFLPPGLKLDSNGWITGLPGKQGHIHSVLRLSINVSRDHGAWRKDLL